MKKKIIIVSDSFRVGGIQKSLINLLNKIDYKKYDVSLFAFNDEKMEDINKCVKIIPSNKLFRIVASPSNEIKQKGRIYFFLRKCLAMLCKVFGSNVVYSLIYKTINIDEKYDIGISYSNNVDNHSLYYGYNKFVLEKINADYKICWVHIDYSKRVLYDWEYEEYNKFDKIVAVSNACKKSIIEKHSDLDKKTTIVYNFIDVDEIIKKSKEPIAEKLQKNTIIGIGRLEKDKNFSEQIEIALELKKRGIIFEWIIIGEGNERNYLQSLINKYELNDFVKLIGIRSNVYPYIKRAKIFVSTSLTESFGLSIVEALAMNVPVVAFYYPALSEILDGKNGIICKERSEIIESIYELLTNDLKYSMLKKNSIYKINDLIIKNQLKKLLEDHDE